MSHIFVLWKSLKLMRNSIGEVINSLLCERWKRCWFYSVDNTCNILPCFVKLQRILVISWKAPTVNVDKVVKSDWRSLTWMLSFCQRGPISEALPLLKIGSSRSFPLLSLVFAFQYYAGPVSRLFKFWTVTSQGIW